MRAETSTLTKIFGRDARYVVPLFQRPYVWKRVENWEPLWDDVRRAAHEVEDGGGHPHFLGAIVIDSTEPQFARLETWEVIDGQQRLTTLQLLLASARSVANEVGAERAGRLLGRFIDNDEDLLDSASADARWKVWPTNADRDAFRAAMANGATGGQVGRARAWFDATIRDWLAQSPDVEDRLEALVTALRERLRLVVIDLEADDDPQVIFETLNGRGTALEAADLVKNLLFRRAIRDGADADLLYETHWKAFDLEPWRETIAVGRVMRSRLDLFLAHWLAMRTQEEVTASSLYARFVKWVELEKPLVDELFEELQRYAALYQSFDAYGRETIEGQFFERMRTYEVTTITPLLLFVWGQGDAVTIGQRQRILRALDSFLIRRAVSRFTASDYNNLFRDVLDEVVTRDEEPIDDVIVSKLSESDVPSRLWPDDATFRRGLTHDPLFQRLTPRPRLRLLLEALERRLRTGLTEQLAAVQEKTLTVEHVLPQSWKEHWRLPDDADEDAADHRQRLLHSIGNLTLATARLNPAMRNEGWSVKKEWLGKHSLLRLTTGSILHHPYKKGVDDDWTTTWDELHIEERGRLLAGEAIKLWPGPDSV